MSDWVQVGRIHLQSLIAQRSAPQTREVGFALCFVNEDNTLGLPDNGRTSMCDPIGALLLYLGAAVP